MASYPSLNLSWESGVPTLYIVQGAKVNINLQNYIYDADGNKVTITLNSNSLPSGLTYNSGIISGTTTSSTAGSLGIKLTDSTNLTSTYTIKVKTVNPSLISTDESNLIHVLGATDTSFTKATTINTKNFFELNHYDGGFTQISILNGKVTAKDYYDDGNLTADYTDTFTMTDTIGGDKILDTVSSTWAVENFTYGEAKAVTSINGILTPGLYKVDVTTKVKTPGTVEKSTDWWESGYSNNGNAITSLSTLKTMLTTTNSNVWMEGNKQVKLLANGNVVSTINDGSLNTWNGVPEYNNAATGIVVGAWTNVNGYLKVTLTTGEVSAFKILNGTLMETSLPASGSSETMTWYYGSSVTLSGFNTKYQLIADSTNTINSTGTAAIDTIIGNSFNNTLNGLVGADILIGGKGNDTYIVDNISDKVTELASQGTDLVKSSATTYTLSTNIENLTLIPATVAINGIGNTLDNTIIGNAANNTLTGLAGNDVLNGGAGIDTLIGGLGNDTYIVDTTSDKVTELASQGTDLVNSSATYTLSANVENLTLTGTALINGTGNELANTIIGNIVANTLNGGLGNDTINGGLGNDILYGGTGADKFVFNTTLNSTTNKDTIKDFSVIDDTIVLENAIFTKLVTLGTLNTANFVSNGTKALDSTDYLVYNKGTGQLFYDADGNAGGTAIQIALIENKAALTYADFTVI